MDNPMQPLFQPYAHLAESNMAAVTQFWTSPEIMWTPFTGMQRSNAQGAGPSAAQSEALSRLMKSLMENYARFLSDMMQSTTMLWGRMPANAPTMWGTPASPERKAAA